MNDNNEFVAGAGFIVVDENNNETEMTILFTFEIKDIAKYSQYKYVAYFNELEWQQGVFVSRYDLEGNLFPLEDEAEWEEADKQLKNYKFDEESEFGFDDSDDEGEYESEDEE